MRSSSSVGVTLDELLGEAEELAAAGVDGAAEMVELIATAIHAEAPIPDRGLTEPAPSECFAPSDVPGRHAPRQTLGWTETLGWDQVSFSTNCSSWRRLRHS